ncbi:MAG: S1/P1 Nuclease, partial [Brevundimonas sp.]
PAADLDGFDVKARTVSYLTTTLGTVIPFYRLEKAGAFRDSDPRGAAFVNERLAAGAAELRDFIASAWTASGSASIGWPAVKVAEVEAGTVDPWIAMVGED